MKHCVFLATIVTLAALNAFSASPEDWRNIRHGREIPSRNYADQPYIVTLPDGAWLCTLTTGIGHEGRPGQHVVATRSTDQGRTWSPLIEIEPPDGPEAFGSVQEEHNIVALDNGDLYKTPSFPPVVGGRRPTGCGRVCDIRASFRLV